MLTFKQFLLERGDVTRLDMKELERFADRLLNRFDIDVEFTKHFVDRMNDPRNKPSISVDELKMLFIKIAQRQGKALKARPDTEAVLKDIQTDLNLPVVINYDRSKNEFEIVHKTIMRKPNFRTRNRVIKY